MTISRLVVASITVLLANCSSLITHSGKQLEEVFRYDATAKHIQKHFGAPVALSTSSALSVPRVKATEGDTNPTNSAVKASSTEAYVYKGLLLRDPSEMAALGMMDGLSLFILSPVTTASALNACRRTHDIKVWYSKDGRWIAYRKTSR